MPLDVPVHQSLDGRTIKSVEVAAGFLVLGQALRLVAGPGLERGDELAVVDQPVLKREQSEQEMAVGGGGHDMAPIVVDRPSVGP